MSLLGKNCYEWVSDNIEITASYSAVIPGDDNDDEIVVNKDTFNTDI